MELNNVATGKSEDGRTKFRPMVERRTITIGAMLPRDIAHEFLAEADRAGIKRGRLAGRVIKAFVEALRAGRQSQSEDA